MDTCEFMHNYIVGKTTMYSEAAVIISNCKAVTMTGNTFKSIGEKANYKGSAVKLWSFENWELTMRFNVFNSNKGGVHIESGTYASHALNGKAYKVPSGTAEYNRFDSSTNYAFAITDLYKVSGTNVEGAIIANGNFNTATASGTF